MLQVLQSEKREIILQEILAGGYCCLSICPCFQAFRGDIYPVQVHGTDRGRAEDSPYCHRGSKDWGGAENNKGIERIGERDKSIQVNRRRHKAVENKHVPEVCKTDKAGKGCSII